MSLGCPFVRGTICFLKMVIQEKTVPIFRNWGTVSVPPFLSVFLVYYLVVHDYGRVCNVMLLAVGHVLVTRWLTVSSAYKSWQSIMVSHGEVDQLNSLRFQNQEDQLAECHLARSLGQVTGCHLFECQKALLSAKAWHSFKYYPWLVYHNGLSRFMYRDHSPPPGRPSSSE